MNLSFGDNDSVSALDKSTIDALRDSMLIHIDTNPDPSDTPDDVFRGIKLLIDTGSDISWMTRGIASPLPGRNAQLTIGTRKEYCQVKRGPKGMVGHLRKYQRPW